MKEEVVMDIGGIGDKEEEGEIEYEERGILWVMVVIIEGDEDGEGGN